jgi:putative phosphoribosyl transferase
MLFSDRSQAGRILARKLHAYAGREDVIVLALPRGGVPVGFEVAEALEAPLDIFVVRKLGVPGQEELAMGAIASGGGRVISPDIVRACGVSDRQIETVIAAERAELERREASYRGDRPALDVRGKVVILVDDGLATGSSMRAAIGALRPRLPARIIVAVPVAPRSTTRQFGSIADEVVCAVTPEPFHAVGEWYENFAQVGDDEVRELLRRANRVPSRA